MRASDLLGPAGPFAARVPGYEHRTSQLRMTDAVEDVLEHDGVLLVEAGTGTGKTLAYLLPAALSERRIVVSTGTRALQDQILQKDVPLLERVLGRSLPVACLKGLSNYLCLRRHDELLARTSADPTLRAKLTVLDRFRATTDTGDLAELDEMAEDAAILAEVASGADTRIGPRCRHYEECFVTRARRRAEDAQIVIVNHHLFFADLALRGPRGGGVLPDYDAVIFDEAHQVEDVATQFFGVSLGTGRLERLARDAARALADGALATTMLDRASRLFSALPRASAVDGGREPLDGRWTPESTEALHALDAALEALEVEGKRAIHDESAVHVGRRAEAIRGHLATIAEGSRGGRVTWMSRRGRSTSVGASPTDVSAIVRDELFFKTRSVVLTSATLSSGGNFDFVKQRLGVDFDVASAVLPSPFDYESQAALYLPRGMPDPRATTWLPRALDEIAGLVSTTGGGAFVLCTSVRSMRELAAGLVARVPRGIPIFVQGSASKAALLDSFRASGNAVLVATMTFWEGVDVPGHALRLVVIDKLPFDVPSDPLVAARCRKLEEAGGEPFMEYLVPSAILTLKQGFGRLVRTTKDRGIVAMLDGRLTTKGYGKLFLRSLPPARRCETLAEVATFYASWQERRGSLLARLEASRA